MTLMKREDTGN